jgi:hypothetical protein
LIREPREFVVGMYLVDIACRANLLCVFILVFRYLRRYCPFDEQHHTEAVCYFKINLIFVFPSLANTLSTTNLHHILFSVSSIQIRLFTPYPSLS